MQFGRQFDEEFINQGNENRSIEETLDLGWKLLSTLPKSMLDRVDEKYIEKYYRPEGDETEEEA